MTDSRHAAFLDECCDALGVQLHEVLGKGRAVPTVVHARQAITWALHDSYPELSWPKLGKLLKRDHSTLMHSAAQFAKGLHARAEWALSMRAELSGKTVPLVGLEGPLDSLRSCPGIDLSTALDVTFELGAVG